MDLEGTIQRHYQVPLEVRSTIIEKKIMGCLPTDYDDGLTGQGKEYESRADLRPHIEKVIDMYAGQDANVLTILSYASQKGRLTEFLTLLEGQYTKGTTGYLLPELRMYAQASNIKKSQEFFMQCYADLDVEACDDVQIMQTTRGEQVRGVCEEYMTNKSVRGNPADFM